MRRRYGYYWTKLVGALVILAAWVLAFIWIGDSWWQLINAGVLAIIMAQLGFLGHDAAHRQIFKSGRWNDWTSMIIANLLVGISYGWWRNKHNRHHANPNKVGADPDIDLGAVAMTPEQATRQRSRLMHWLVSHQGWYFFPILMLEGLSLRSEGIRRVVKRGPVERRWVEFTLLMVRLGGFVALAFLVLSPGKAVAILAVEVAVFGFYDGLDQHAVQPHQRAEWHELLAALRRAVEEDLTDRQRRVFVAVVLNNVPMDVLALELASNRNAIYKTLFDARRKLRASLAANGYLPHTASRRP